ncbi:polysaccharide biosynthesis C-terminal domain-containing protein, partial [Thiomonas arsenitoxydans]
LLASSKYDVSATLIVFIVGGMLVSGGTPIFSAGIYINKLTKVVMYSVLTAAAVNIVLTVLLVRPFGIEGAAFAALVSYILYTVMAAYYGRKVVKISIPWFDVLKYGSFTLIMYGVVVYIDPPDLVFRIFSQIIVGAVVYGALIIIFDRQVRNLLRQGVAKLMRAR